MSGLARKLERHHERRKVQEFYKGQVWKALVNFCRLHSPHGEMEFQSDGEQDYMACILCGVSFDCEGELPRKVLNSLMRHFSFSVWFSV